MSPILRSLLIVEAAAFLALVCFDPRVLIQPTVKYDLEPAPSSGSANAPRALRQTGTSVPRLRPLAADAPAHLNATPTELTSAAGAGAPAGPTSGAIEKPAHADALLRAQRMIDAAIAAHVWTADDARALGELQMQIPAEAFQNLLTGLIPYINRQELRLVDVDQLLM